MPRRVLLILGLLLAGGVVLVALGRAAGRASNAPAAPLDAPAAGEAPWSEPPASAWPADTLLLNAGSARTVNAPFALREDASAPGGCLLVLPKGAGTKQRTGRAVFDFRVPEAGVYALWARVRWTDECSNSVDVQITAHLPRTLGNDQTYNVWHWVGAGALNLAEGAGTLTLIEREDGIALQQLFLTRDTAFQPSGPVRLTSAPDALPAQPQGRDRREFHDSFSRSPGHGLGPWEAAAGRWEIAFSFDPNRIPNQYTLVGRPDGGEAVVRLKGPPWDGCRFSFSFCPEEAGFSGLRLDRGAAGEQPLHVGFEVSAAGASLRVAGAGPEGEALLADSVRLGQWHRVEVECGPRVLRVRADGREIHNSPDFVPGAVAVGFFVASGRAAFDDVSVEDLGPGPAAPEFCRLGFYPFAESHIADPSDYLDFTPAEQRAMQNDPAAEKLRREAKYMPLIGSPGHERALWLAESGHWNIAQGVLVGRGPNAALRHAREAGVELEVRLKVRLAAAGSVAEVELYGGREGSLRVRASASPDGGGAALAAPLPADGKWHEWAIHAWPGQIESRMDGAAPCTAAVRHGAGSRISLRVPQGRVEFDDVELEARRSAPQSGFYAFDRQETDWWRTGGKWVDHDGVTCILASNWVSLVAPQGSGLLWNKRAFGPDVLLACDIDENTEWLGWDAAESHIHHPFDNVWLVLAPAEDAAQGYRVELNAEGRTATVLYRLDKEVARVAQDGRFPMTYVGGHAPYSPRRNRVGIEKRGGRLAVIVNERVVLTWDDPAPLAVGRVALGGHHTRINFSYAEVRTLGGE